MSDNNEMVSTHEFKTSLYIFKYYNVNVREMCEWIICVLNCDNVEFIFKICIYLIREQ